MNVNIPEAIYSQIPNIELDYWLDELDPCSFKVMCFLWRKSNGAQKNIDNISLKKIMEGTNLSKSNICKCLKDLENHGLIIKKINKNSLGSHDANTYVINLKNLLTKKEGGKHE